MAIVTKEVFLARRTQLAVTSDGRLIFQRNGRTAEEHLPDGTQLLFFRCPREIIVRLGLQGGRWIGIFGRRPLPGCDPAQLKPTIVFEGATDKAVPICELKFAEMQINALPPTGAN